MDLGPQGRQPAPLLQFPVKGGIMSSVKIARDMDEHPISLEVLDRFASFAATAAERKAVVRHLIKGCGSCRSYLSQLWPSPTERSRLAEVRDDRYDEAFARALERACAAFGTYPEAGAASAEPLLAELAAHSPKQQEMLVRNHPRYWSAELCGALVARSHEARFTNTAVMRHQAQLAVLVAESLSPGPQASGEVADGRARAWAALGNALRVSGNLMEAESALSTSLGLLKGGSQQRPLYAHVLSQLASLRMDQRRFDDSVALIQQVVQIWRNLGDPRELAGALIKQAIITGEAGKPKSAVRILLAAGRLVDSAAEPKLALILVHSVIRFYVDGGHSEMALRLYLEARPLYEQVPDPLIRIKALWLEGQIMSAERHLEPALKLLSAAREAYLSKGIRVEAASVALDLAAVLAKLGRFGEMRTLARETLREMEARGVHREAIAALILLQQAATSETALALIRRVASALRKSRRHPNDGRFEPLL
jgi:tetratricopeptide (TPR) repeat protein